MAEQLSLTHERVDDIPLLIGLMQRLRRLFQRARLEKEELNILRGILSAAQKPAKRNS